MGVRDRDTQAEHEPATVHWASEETVVRAQAGDADSLEYLLVHSHPHVRRFARMLCSSREDADDATQEAMLVLFASIGTLRSPAALAAWMFKIVRHECLRLGRRVLQSTTDADEIVQLTVEDPASLRLRVVQLVDAISTLPPEMRLVFIMRDVRGFSGAETASLLGISTAAMKTRLHRARAHVREAIQSTA